MQIADASQLNKTITLMQAITIAIGTILGTGVLILPGLVYEKLGPEAIYAWSADIVLLIPLLFIFSILGKNNPAPAGASAYIEQAYPYFAKGFAYVLLGGLLTGLTAVALTGGSYLSYILPETLKGNRIANGMIAISIELIVVGINLRGIKDSAYFQNFIIVILLTIISFIVFKNIQHLKLSNFKVSQFDYSCLWQGMGLAFFAFSGWETIASTVAEYKNPKRDFPLAIAISFIIIASIYLTIAACVQADINQNNLAALHAPLFSLIEKIIQGKTITFLILLIVGLIIFANLNGLFISVSRLLYSFGINRWIQKAEHFKRLNQYQVPANALLIAFGITFSLNIFYIFNCIDIETLINLAGENCAIIYLACIAAYLKIEKQYLYKLIALFVLLFFAIFMVTFFKILLFSICMFILPYLTTLRR